MRGVAHGDPLSCRRPAAPSRLSTRPGSLGDRRIRT
jgi:hypothetical protein